MLACLNKFLFIFNVKIIWPPLEYIVQFIDSMSANGLADSTVRTYMPGIVFYLKLDKYIYVTQHFLVKEVNQNLKI